MTAHNRRCDGATCGLAAWLLLASAPILAQPDFVVDFGDPICRWTINPDSWLAKRAINWEFKASSTSVTAVTCTATAVVPVEKATPPPPAARQCAQRANGDWCYVDTPGICLVCTPAVDEPLLLHAPVADEEEYEEEYDEPDRDYDDAAYFRDLHEEWHADEAGDEADAEPACSWRVTDEDGVTTCKRHANDDEEDAQ